MKNIMMMIVVASLAACAYNPITQNPIFRPHEMKFAQVNKPNWSGQSVAAAEAYRHAGGEDGRSRLKATSFRVPGFQGMHVLSMQRTYPKATHYALFSGGMHMPAVTCNGPLGRPLSVVYADLDGDGYYDPALMAAPVRTEVYAPIELPGQRLEIVGLRCTNSGRCVRVWTKTQSRTGDVVQIIDSSHH